jgi:hypothetical protein
MAYAQGDLILKDHYNTFSTGTASGTADHNVANINTVWGVGNGNKGYGQSTVLTPVTSGAVVTATQWSTLIARLNTILTHQAGAGSGVTSPVSGDLIAYLSTLSGKVTDAYNNRLNFNSLRGSASTTNYTALWTSATPTTFQQVRTVTFVDADAARYFFNAGGRIGISLSVPAGGTDNTKESSWLALTGTGIGTLSLDALTSVRSGTGFTLTTNGSAVGFWDLTGTDQTLIKLTDTVAAYNTNFVEVLCKVTGTAGVNGGLGTTITFTINYNDAATDSTGSGNFFDDISMTMRAAVTVTPPETVNLTSTWGTPTPAATVN